MSAADKTNRESATNHQPEASRLLPENGKDAASDEVGVQRHRREQRARKTAIIAMSAQGINYAIRFISIPLSLRLLGKAQYGLWLTVGSILFWLGLSELGVSTGIVNKVAQAYGREDWQEIDELVSTGFFFYTLLAVLALAIVMTTSMWSGLPHFLGVSSGDLSIETRKLFIVCGIIWAASFSITSIGPLCLALQEGYLQNYAQVLASILSLSALSVLAWRGASLVEFALGMGLPPLVSSCGLALYFFFWRHSRVRPSWRKWKRDKLASLMSIGGPMAIVQLADVSIMYSISIIIANRLGADQVPLYSVPATAFIVVMSICNTLVSPYLSAYAEASGRRDWLWIRAVATRNLLVVIAVMLLANVVLVAGGPYLIGLWTGGQVTPNRTLLLWIGLFYTMMTWGTTNSTLLVGLGLARAKAWIHCPVALIYLCGAWFGLPHYGLLALPVAGCLGFSIDFSLSLPTALNHISRSLAAKEHESTFDSRKEDTNCTVAI